MRRKRRIKTVRTSCSPPLEFMELPERRAGNATHLPVQLPKLGKTAAAPWEPRLPATLRVERHRERRQEKEDDKHRQEFRQTLSRVMESPPLFIGSSFQG